MSIEICLNRFYSIIYSRNNTNIFKHIKISI